jgi:hypothetical protein
MAQNSEPARRGPGRPFRRGRSGNPGGRPAGLRRAIQHATTNGRDLAELMVKVMAGQPLRLDGRLYRPSLEDSLMAATWLADRGFGKPVSAIELMLAEEPPG